MSAPPDHDAPEAAGLHDEVEQLRARVAELEAALARARDESRFALSVLEGAPVVIYAKAVDHRFVLSNRQHAQLIGLPHDGILGRSDADLLGDAAAEIDLVTQRVMATGEAASSEFTIPLEGRELTFLETIFPLPGATEGLLGVGGIAQDISARKQIETELAAHRANLEELVRRRADEIRAVFRAVPDRYFRVRRDGVVLDFLAGRTTDSLVPDSAAPGQPLGRFLPAKLSQRIHDGLEALAGGKSMVELECELEVGGALRAYEARVLSLASDEAVVVVRDVTERHAAVNALAAARDAAENASKVKSDFVARMSHELRTPLSAIVGFAELLLDGELTPENRSHALGVRRNADHLLALVEDILDVARIEAGALDFRSEPVPLREMLDELTGRLRPLALARHLALEVCVDASAPASFVGDRLRLEQILANLVTNAIKYTDEGRVSVDVRAERSPSGECSLVVDVNDTGVGIAPEHVPRLFAAFVQVHGRGAARGRGVGLGLAIAARLVEGMGGVLVARSVLGEGSTFTLRLPLTSTESPAPRAPSSDAVAPRESPSLGAAPSSVQRVLVVDDSPDLRVLLGRMMGKLGLETTLASDGQQALDRIAEAEERGSPFDLIFMDMQMPVLDGYEAVRRLRAQGSQVRIVALTAFAMTGDADVCLAAGCNWYLAKPLGFPRLRQFLEEILPATASERA